MSKTYRIKPLEWHFRSSRTSEVWSSKVPGFYVEVRRHRVKLQTNGAWAPWHLIVEDGEGFKTTEAKSLEHGKELAWQDWVKRLEGALEELK